MRAASSFIEESVVGQPPRDHPVATPGFELTPRTTGSKIRTVSRSARRREQLDVAAELRGHGADRATIAATLRDRYGVNARVAMRLACGWSQADVAVAWCTRWPDDPKTFKNISYWENWPSTTGYSPSLAVLDRLAQLYQCDAADLVADWGTHATTRSARPTIDAEAETLAWQVANLDLPELTRATGDWARRLPETERRAQLLKLSTAASYAAHDAVEPERPRHRSGTTGHLTGRWISRYGYRSTSRDAELTSTHTVDLQLDGGRLVGRADVHTSTSELTIVLDAEGGLLTGTWTERTSPTGHYRAATFHGLLQLVVDPTGHSMSGMWLGVTKRYTIKAGEWRLDRLLDDDGRPVTTATTVAPSTNSPAAAIANTANSILPT